MPGILIERSERMAVMTRTILIGRNMRIVFMSIYMTAFLSGMGMASGKYPGWTVYKANGKAVNAISIRGDEVWVGTSGGVAMIDRVSNETVVFNTSNSGLPDNEEPAFAAMDSSGNKWFTASRGILEFDGAEWKIYDTSKSGLGGNYLYNMAIDASGNKWMGGRRPITMSRTIYAYILIKFDGSNWTSYPVSSEVGSIAFDSNGDKWFAIGDSIAWFNDTNWTYYDHDNSGLPAGLVLSITIDASGTKWIASSGGGITKFDGTNWTTYSTANSSIPTNDIHKIVIDDSGNKWIATGGSGLVRFDDTNWTVYNTSNSGLPDNNVRLISIDTAGTKWIATSNGFVKFDGVNWQVCNSAFFGLPSNYISAIAIDSSGDKWVGTRYYSTTIGGLAKFDGKNWIVYNAADSILPNREIPILTIDIAGNKWIGTDKGALVKFDSTWTKYKSPYDGLINHYGDILAIDFSGNKWLGTSSGGLLKFDGTDWTVYTTHNSTLPDSNITALAIDALDNKWIGTPEGLVKFDGANWTNYFPYNSGLPVRSIIALATDRSGNIWIGNGTAGLVKFDGTNWTAYDSTNSGLPFNAVHAIVIDPSNTKWLVSRGRLVKFDGNKWDVFDSSNSGLPNNTIEKLSIDRDGTLWMSLSSSAPGGIISYNDKLNPVRYPDFADKNTPRDFVCRISPNPFKTSVMISFDLSRPAFVSSSIFSISGKKIKTLFNGAKPAGAFKMSWNGTDDSGKHMPSGVYFYEIVSSSARISGTMHLIR